MTRFLALASVILLCGSANASPREVDPVRGETIGAVEAAIPLLAPDARPAANTLWLHSRVKGQCVYYYAKHEHEAYVTRGRDGPRTSVDRIRLSSEIGGHAQDKACTNASQCARTEEEFNAGCRRSCVSARAWIGGSSAETGRSCIW